MTQENNFVRPVDVAAFGFDWGRLSLTVGPEVNGARQFSGGVVDLPAGQGHARHNHPGAEEIIFVIAGAGEQMVEDPNGVPEIRSVGPPELQFSFPRAASTPPSTPATVRCSCSSSTPRRGRSARYGTCRIFVSCPRAGNEAQRQAQIVSRTSFRCAKPRAVIPPTIRLLP